MTFENASKMPPPSSPISAGHLEVPSSSVMMAATGKAAMVSKTAKEPLSPVAPPAQVEVNTKEKHDGYIKKKIYIEKHAIPKGQESQYVYVKLKYEDGHWYVKQSSRKIKI